MLTEDEIVFTLSPLNGTHFHINDVPAYAIKLLTRGKAICRREAGDLASYVLFYDDGPRAFVSMVWTNPRMLHRGLATSMMEELSRRVAKPIELEVDRHNVAAKGLYAKLGYEYLSGDGERERWVLGRRVAIMQPYVFPYIGYLQLVDAADLFVFYDDVHFIKRGRIHRNHILVNGAEHQFTVPIADASQNRLISETALHGFDRWRDQFLKQLTYSYRKAPHFNDAIGAIEGVLGSGPGSIADLAVASIRGIHAYLGKPFDSVRASEFAPESRRLEKGRRLVDITKKADGSRYVNTPGGRELYDKADFRDQGVSLCFLQPVVTEYRQFGGPFVGRLSAIDLMMFNAPERIVDMIGCYGID